MWLTRLIRRSERSPSPRAPRRLVARYKEPLEEAHWDHARMHRLSNEILLADCDHFCVYYRSLTGVTAPPTTVAADLLAKGLAPEDLIMVAQAARHAASHWPADTQAPTLRAMAWLASEFTSCGRPVDAVARGWLLVAASAPYERAPDVASEIETLLWRDQVDIISPRTNGPAGMTGWEDATHPALAPLAFAAGLDVEEARHAREIGPDTLRAMAALRGFRLPSTPLLP